MRTSRLPLALLAVTFLVIIAVAIYYGTDQFGLYDDVGVCPTPPSPVGDCI